MTDPNDPSNSDTSAEDDATGGPGDRRTSASTSVLRVMRRPEVGFALVGGFNTVFGIALTVLWLAVLGDDWPPAVAVVLAYAMGVVTAFVLHRAFVFRVRGRLIRDFLGFVAVNSGGLVLNILLLTVAVDMLDLPRIPAAVAVMAIVAVITFFGHRHISFRRPTATRPGPEDQLPERHDAD